VVGRSPLLPDPLIGRLAFNGFPAPATAVPWGRFGNGISPGGGGPVAGSRHYLSSFRVFAAQGCVRLLAGPAPPPIWGSPSQYREYL